MDVSYLFTLSFLSRTFNETAFMSMFAGMFVVPVSNWILNAIVQKKYPFLLKSKLYWLFLLGWYALRRLIISVVVFYFFDQILESNEERAGLLSVTALLQLLALAGIFDHVYKPSLAETPKTILYMYGAFGVVAANAITLATELMLKLRKGQRTLTDLRVIVLPFECVFVLSWIALWTHAYCEYNSKIHLS
ncbi:uncharacterized protein LOC105906566 isoform X2 [Clupea harengus]|uniref:Uncharacterized protein LOC105906566 isoform X2 n=1 Tax=Clupea harengus TaxID=7950 RepID=A0A6P8FWA6_CLUHA|nr:uncharacterized protein LOC105906566 isoform X2 [Clupea harengus]